MKPGGFTLVELLVSLLIFGMLSAAGVALLSVSVRTQEASADRLDALAATRRAGALIGSDLAQAAARPYRDSGGTRHAAFSGESGGGDATLLAFVRRGWENVDGADRPSLQKIVYRLEGGRLERIAYPFVDGAEPLPGATILEQVRGLRLRFRDKEGQWRDRWDPEEADALPAAVEMVAEVEGSAAILQLFPTGAGA